MALDRAQNFLWHKRIVGATSLHTGCVCCILILAGQVVDSPNDKVLVSFEVFSLFASQTIVTLLNQQWLENKKPKPVQLPLSVVFPRPTAKITRGLEYCMSLKVNFYQRSDSRRSVLFLSKVMPFPS